MLSSLNGKTVLVTGAGRGIGRAIALAFAKAGSHIIVNVRTESDDVVALRQAIESHGVSSYLALADISVSEQVDAMLRALKQEGVSIDILINNAGITRDGLLIRMKESDWDDVLNTNLKGAFLLTKAVGKFMLKQRSGAIVNISSVIGVIGNAGQANYAASKAGLIGFTKATAKEFASRGVRVNAIAPGFIQSKMTDALTDEVKQRYFDSIPLGAFGSVEDVANTALYLSSNLATYVTGQTIHVDGGLVM